MLRNILLAALLLAAPLVADASPITYNFSVTATSGPLSGTTANGTFTFDSGSIPGSLPGEVNATGLLTSLAFTWNGISYNQTTANTGRLEFDAAGHLIGAVFGTNCSAGTCIGRVGTHDWFFALQPLEPNAAQQFAYTTGLFDPLFGFGTETLAPAGTVPEPATLALLGLGLAGLALTRRAVIGQ